MIMFQQFSNGMKCNFESAKSKKMGDIMFCSAWRLWFYVVSWSIWPNDHHMSTNLDFSMFPSQTELLSTKKRPKIYVTGLKISKNDMIFMTMDVCCWPWLFWSLMSFGSMLKLQASHDLTKDIRRFDRTIRGWKKKEQTLLEYWYTTF